MSLVRLIAWRPLLAVAVVARIAVGPSAPSDHASATVEMPADRPAGPRPHRRCRGPPTAGRAAPTGRPRPTPQRRARPILRPIPSAYDPVPDHHQSRRPVQAPPFAGTDVLEPPMHNRTTSATTPSRPGSAGTTVRLQPDQVSGIAGLRTRPADEPGDRRLGPHRAGSCRRPRSRAAAGPTDRRCRCALRSGSPRAHRSEPRSSPAGRRAGGRRPRGRPRRAGHARPPTARAGWWRARERPGVRSVANAGRGGDRAALHRGSSPTRAPAKCDH